MKLLKFGYGPVVLGLLVKLVFFRVPTRFVLKYTLRGHAS